MSNKRNARRQGQRVRSEVSRKPKKITKAHDVFMASLAGERARKERERYYKTPTKTERRAREIRIRRWRLRVSLKRRKPRTNTRLARHDHNN